MEGKEVSVTLPEDLVRRILSMVPFPFIFKARLVSKSWLARFSSISTQENDEKKHLAISFQNQVGDWSTNWKTFCPLVFCRDDFVAYDRASHAWQIMPSLSFLPKHIVLRSDLHIEGAMVFLSGWEVTEYKEYVANILTRSWKHLPSRSHAGGDFLAKRLVTSLGMYKVIVIYGGVGQYLVVQIYDSKLDAWSSKKHVVSKGYSYLSAPVYLNGVLYMIADQNPRDLLAFNVEEETLEELEMRSIDIRETVPADLVVCNGNLMMIAYDEFYTYQRMTVLKIDPRSRRLLEVARGPPAALNVDRFIPQPASDGDCIFFRSGKCGYTVLEYDVHQDEWSNITLPVSVQTDSEWSVSSFRPGFNPFMEV